MSVLNPPFHATPHFNLRLLCAVLAMAGVILFFAIGPIGTEPKASSVADDTSCATDAPGCEMRWLQQLVTDIEHPIAILSPEAN